MTGRSPLRTWSSAMDCSASTDDDDDDDNDNNNNNRDTDVLLLLLLLLYLFFVKNLQIQYVFYICWTCRMYIMYLCCVCDSWLKTAWIHSLTPRYVLHANVPNCTHLASTVQQLSTSNWRILNVCQITDGLSKIMFG